MIYSLTGNIIHTEPDLCVIECGGVGYACKTTMNTITAVSSLTSCTLYTYMAVREDAIDLFGFFTKDELECFKLLTSVSGVGSKYALAILSSLTPASVALAIASDDTKAFSKIKGIGAKIAQRIVMELKDKVAKGAVLDSTGEVGAITAAVGDNNKAEAIAALVVLGYTQSEAAQAVAKCPEGLETDEIIKRSLRALASGRF
ncbi:MAG: Holliday junction branch migration protein RuvA [Oscillospiraceae bacterium]|nr:Holliday junction branch migration protein RuvA [Oscillospiraceae bacterium]